jgi:hypothetical protein
MTTTLQEILDATAPTGGEPGGWKMSFPAQPVAHYGSRCPKAEGGVSMTEKQLRAVPRYYKVCEDCSTHRSGNVTLALPVHAEHAYDPCMVWPGGAWRCVCRVCYGTHDGETYLGLAFPSLRSGAS